MGGNDFASNIIFELHSDNEKYYYVKVRVNGNYVNLCGKKNTECDYTLFKLLTKWNVVNNLEEICGKKIQTRARGGEETPSDERKHILIE